MRRSTRSKINTEHTQGNSRKGADTHTIVEINFDESLTFPGGNRLYYRHIRSLSPRSSPFLFFEMSNSDIAENMFLFGTGSPAAAGSAPAETQLIDRACSGDRDAFGDLYRMYAPLVHGIVLARVPHDDVQDIVQDVFLAAYNNLHTLRDRKVIGGWLASIARNRAAEFYRQTRPTEELSELITGRNNPDAEAREILAAIRSLPESYRETLVLRLVEGMTGVEIAERTGLKPESVRVNLHRGMELLRQALGVGGRK